MRKPAYVNDGFIGGQYFCSGNGENINAGIFAILNTISNFLYGLNAFCRASGVHNRCASRCNYNIVQINAAISREGEYNGIGRGIIIYLFYGSLSAIKQEIGNAGVGS